MSRSVTMPSSVPLLGDRHGADVELAHSLGDGIHGGVGRDAFDALVHHVLHFHGASSISSRRCSGAPFASYDARDLTSPRSSRALILDLPHGGVEGVADGDIDVLVGVVLRAFLVHVHVLAGHADVDAHFVQLALLMMAMRRLDGHVAGDDAVEEALELGCLFADDRFDGGEGSMLRKLICIGTCMTGSFTRPLLSSSPPWALGR